MTYDFSFDKKSLGFLLVGFSVVGVLLFLAGWLTGANLNRTEPLATNTTLAKASAGAEPEVPALPAEPAVKDDALRIRRDVAATPEETTAQARQSAAAASAAAASPSARQDYGTDALEPLPKSSTPKANTDPVIISTTTPQGGGSADSAGEAAGNMAGFSVQVGVFLEERDAERLATEMREKGYTPSIFSAPDMNNRMWYSVRIGAYSDRTEASQAATNFTKQEKIKAVVRPFDSL